LKAHGLEPSDVARVLVSHHHIDHAGNAKRLREAGAEICVHEADAHAVEKWREVAPERNKAYGEGLVRAGVPKEILSKIDRRGREVDIYMDSCPVDRRLKEGDRVVAGDRELRVLHTPGHSAGSALYLDPQEPLTATGDTLLERITPNALTVRREEAGALSTYLQTLRRLREEDLGVALPGHGMPFVGVERVIDRAFEHYEKRRDRILGHLGDKKGGLSVWDLVERLWPDPSRGSAFLMVSEVLGHLELLIDDEAVTVQEPAPGEVAVYHPVG
jgi:glyoxylase-like metal-dependent hydrolase (beta-lactamase superfamily II)